MTDGEEDKKLSFERYATRIIKAIVIGVVIWFMIKAIWGMLF